jgi:hypothetical protein
MPTITELREELQLDLRHAEECKARLIEEIRAQDSRITTAVAALSAHDAAVKAMGGMPDEPGTRLGLGASPALANGNATTLPRYQSPAPRSPRRNMGDEILRVIGESESGSLSIDEICKQVGGIRPQAAEKALTKLLAKDHVCLGQYDHYYIPHDVTAAAPPAPMFVEPADGGDAQQGDGQFDLENEA